MKVIKQFDGVPNGEIYPVTYMPGDECPPELEATMLHFAGRTHAAVASSIGGSSAPALSDSGPTVAQFVAAGYLAKNYPPEGYASRSTAEEITQAISDQDAALAQLQLAEGQVAATLAAAGAEQSVDAKRLVPSDDDEADGALTVAQLREALTAKGIQFDPKAKKPELQALLPKD